MEEEILPAALARRIAAVLLILLLVGSLYVLINTYRPVTADVEPPLQGDRLPSRSPAN